jgi:hypothetical protein
MLGVVLIGPAKKFEKYTFNIYNINCTFLIFPDVVNPTV